jgi:hypothetical protein
MLLNLDARGILELRAAHGCGQLTAQAKHKILGENWRDCTAWI